MIFHVIFPREKSIRQKWGRGDPFFKIKYNCVVPYASESVTANIHRPSHLFFYGRHSTFILNKKVLCEKFYFFLDFFGNKCTLLFVHIEMMVCMILCCLYFIPSKKYPNEQYNIENFGVLMCPLSILIFFFFFFLGPFGIPLGRLAHLIKNLPSSEILEISVRITLKPFS